MESPSKAKRAYDKWTAQEVAIFQAHHVRFGNRYELYKTVLDRSYTQIKCYYHNHRRKEEKLLFPKSKQATGTAKAPEPLQSTVSARVTSESTESQSPQIVKSAVTDFDFFGCE